MIDYGYKCDKKIPSFIHNGNSWYCHEKTAKKVERKFGITEIYIDKEQLKEEKRKEEKEIKKGGKGRRKKGGRKREKKKKEKRKKKIKTKMKRKNKKKDGVCKNGRTKRS